MSKKDQNSLLKRAEEEFTNGEYRKSLQSYGLLLKDNPDLGEAKVGVYLSDLGMDSEDDAQALFDYYQVLKSENENAVEIIDEIIHTLDSSKNSLQELLIDPIKEQAEYDDGIRYDDFLKFIENRGNFKEAFEDIMFSTKVIITSKDEFIDFIKHLALEGFPDMALAYLDTAVNNFDNDQSIYELYHLLNKEIK
jgi:tetratricopeptide (TPR) repeat protein